MHTHLKKYRARSIRGASMNTFIGTITVIGVLLAFTGALMFGEPSSAQTDFNIKGKQSNLEKDYREELDKWMLRAYEGDRDAQFKVGVLFTNDQFSAPDFEQAVYWYKQAARQGHVLAQYNLGHQYLGGVGVDKSETKAIEWWLKAAKQGHALAQFNVGRAYYLGIGLKEDHKLSREWFERAASNGEPKSVEILEQLGWAKQGQYADQLAKAASQSGAASSGSKSSASKTDTAGASKQATKRAETVGSSNKNSSPIAIYTDPAVRSVLIAIVNVRDELRLVSESETWSTVTSDVGFPVWVHGDYINVVDDKGTVSGDAVNARSVPIVTNGTVVGQLNRNEKVAVLDQRNEWYRVVAPARFKAWVKTDDYKAAPELIEVVEEKAVASSVTNSANDDNAWLFKQSASAYTLQLASFDDPAKVSEFTSRPRFKDNPKLHRFSAQGKDITWTYFLYGQYDNKDKAEKAKKEIKQKRAWIRSFGRLQQNRCVAWKKQLPTPKELNTYCVE